MRNRRDFLRGLAGLAAGTVIPLARPQAPAGEYLLFWGDLHSHNSVGLAQGSTERLWDAARSHLDFCAHIPHAQWHDMPDMPNNAHQKWVDGFARSRELWPTVQKLTAAYNKPGRFATFLGYEWHSSFFGDHNVIYPKDHMPLQYANHVRDLQKHCRQSGAIMIPHHPAYGESWRGANWNFLEPEVSPVIEMYSEHGLAEWDRGTRDYIRHSMSGRYTPNTYQAVLKNGFKVGLFASSDDHLAYPGAYGEGVGGVWATELTREAIWEAIRARRTTAATGDRIQILWKLNGRWLGSILPFTEQREIEVSVFAPDEIDRVDILKNSRVVHRHFPADQQDLSGQWPSEAMCRVEFGWGPWADLNMPRTCDWEGTISLRGGKVRSATPCFQSRPLDEKRRNRILARTENSVRFQSYTARANAFEDRPTNALLLHLSGDRNAVLEVALTLPVKKTFQKTLAELMRSSAITFTGPFQSESVLIHRLVTPDLFRARYRFADRGRRGTTDWYYVRVTQTNGHQAWASPIWVEG